MEKDVLHGYKAFLPGMVCEPSPGHRKQYAENTVFEEEGGEICESGMMHYCVNPMVLFSYYTIVRDPDGGLAEFAEVESLCDPVTDDGFQYATKKIRIHEKISIQDLIQMAAQESYHITTFHTAEKDYSGNHQLFEKSVNAQTGGFSANYQVGASSANIQIGISSGNFQQGIFAINGQVGSCCANVQTNEFCGNMQAAICSESVQFGKGSISGQTRSRSRNKQDGGFSANAQTGTVCKNFQTGERCGSIQTGRGCYSIQEGIRSAAAATGISCSLNAAGKDSIAVAWGIDNKAKGKIGAYLVLSEWNSDGELLGAKMVKVDGETIKEDTYYHLVGGEVIESVA